MDWIEEAEEVLRESCGDGPDAFLCRRAIADEVYDFAQRRYMATKERSMVTKSMAGKRSARELARATVGLLAEQPTKKAQAVEKPKPREFFQGPAAATHGDNPLLVARSMTEMNVVARMARSRRPVSAAEAARINPGVYFMSELVARSKAGQSRPLL